MISHASDIYTTTRLFVLACFTICASFTEELCADIHVQTFTDGKVASDGFWLFGSPVSQNKSMSCLNTAEQPCLPSSVTLNSSCDICINEGDTLTIGDLTAKECGCYAILAIEPTPDSQLSNRTRHVLSPGSESVNISATSDGYCVRVIPAMVSSMAFALNVIVGDGKEATLECNKPVIPEDLGNTDDYCMPESDDRPLASPSVSKGFPVGAIVVIAVGGTALLVLVAVVVICLVVRKHRTSSTHSDAGSRRAAELWTDSERPYDDNLLISNRTNSTTYPYHSNQSFHKF